MNEIPCARRTLDRRSLAVQAVALVCLAFAAAPKAFAEQEGPAAPAAPAAQSARATQVVRAATTHERSASGVRTLDDITIEGEITMPQVLFVTVRDRPRYHDCLHRQYRPTAAELFETTVLPTRLAVLEPGGLAAGVIRFSDDPKTAEPREE